MVQHLVGQAGGSLRFHVLYVVLQSLILLRLHDLHVWDLPGCLEHLIEVLVILIFCLGGRPWLLGLRPLASHLLLAFLALLGFLSEIELF